MQVHHLEGTIYRKQIMFAGILNDINQQESEGFLFVLKCICLSLIMSNQRQYTAGFEAFLAKHIKGIQKIIVTM